jgi:hypothetical protein
MAARRAKRENGALGEDPPGSTMWSMVVEEFDFINVKQHRFWQMSTPNKVSHERSGSCPPQEEDLISLCVCMII